ncbi:hypothetical protein PF010_g25859 [Phytophthora fragariae]|nr:hypothetical protein PF009_g27042 [Phytophthora fragariae]KAE8973740.1 hypothetical protein PF011_g25132 [Phytophthora fragariae]KAE9071479.1 hypothetical protein PF010_g25859 [Phytophthora fragariae]KAE9072047.1 hypothetical protein PF007_g26322 [Phytophthora fragariae]KAE9076719.1 hypothetical protein PF006_g28068 [Phytophthora fragariae]
MDAVMHSFGFVILYVFPPSVGSPYDLDKLQSSFLTVANEDYPIFIGELQSDPKTGVVNVKQMAESQQKGATGIRFETNSSNPMTTLEAMQKLSWDLMPTSRGDTEPICVKGTLLADGGLAVGVDASHTLVDGEGMFTFMTVWGQHYSGVRKEDRLVVCHDRHLLGGTGAPSTMQHPEFRLVGAESGDGAEAEAKRNDQAPVPPPTVHRLFHFTPKMMKKIKEVVVRGGVATDDDAELSYVSTTDAITALFTVLISRARGHGKDVRITTGVNARRRLEPPLPENYVGNVIFNALSTYTNSELQAGEDEEDVVSPAKLGKLARRVRASILQRDDAYLRDAIIFLTEQSNISAVQVGTNFFFGPDLMFTSWVHMGMYSAEFDGTRPWYACVPKLPCYDGFVMITEVQKGGDGVYVGVFLECNAMEILQKMFQEVKYIHD